MGPSWARRRPIGAREPKDDGNHAKRTARCAPTRQRAAKYWSKATHVVGVEQQKSTLLEFGLSDDQVTKPSVVEGFGNAHAGGGEQETAPSYRTALSSLLASVRQQPTSSAAISSALNICAARRSGRDLVLPHPTVSPKNNAVASLGCS